MVVDRADTLVGQWPLRAGDGVVISRATTLFTVAHDPHSTAFAGRTRSTVVGAWTWIASRAVVLVGVAIGESDVAAADAGVRGSIEPRTLSAGNAARITGRRSRVAQSELPPYRRLFR
jgi:putative colanic acid biosynthesis acetyltransferase WcaF